MVAFPLLLIPLAIYNIIVFLMPGVSFAELLPKLKLISGAEWTLTLGEVLVASGVLLLLLEVIKGARPGAKNLFDLLLSLLVFGGAAAEFLMLPQFASSTFFLLALLALVDFLSGLALRTQRRARFASSAEVSSRGARAAAAAESHFEPRSASSTSTAEVESALPNRTDAKGVPPSEPPSQVAPTEPR